MDYRKEYEELSVVDKQIQIDKERKEIPDPKIIEDILEEMLHTKIFPLIPFSAKKINGKKLYEYARAGTPIFLEAPMCVYKYKVLAYTFPILEIECEVGSGTYIRSLAHRLGSKL